MEKVTNIGDAPNIAPSRTHEIKIAANKIVKMGEENNIPVFVVYYDPKKGYQYNAVFAEELESPDLESQYGRFKDFLKICIGFNKQDIKPKIVRKKQDVQEPKLENDLDDSDL